MMEVYKHIASYPSFKWGSSDCVNFIADYVGIVAPHKSKKDAINIIREAGSFESLVDQYLTRKELPKCMRGDIVMIDGDQGKTLGICDGDNVLCNTRNGVVRVTMEKALYCWVKPCQQ